VTSRQAWTGQEIRRVEDVRLLTGAGRFRGPTWCCLKRAGCCIWWRWRSPVAHARVRGIDVTAVRDAPGASGPCSRTLTWPGSAACRS